MTKQTFLPTFHWLRENLFRGPVDSAITLGVIFLFYLTIPPLFEWAFLKASFSGSGPDECNQDGACWIFIREFFPQFMFGAYPEESRWRIYLILAIAVITALGFVIRKHRFNNRFTHYCLWGLT